MNNGNINLHNYYIKLVNLQNYTLIDVSHFKVKLCKFYTFFYYTYIECSKSCKILLSSNASSILDAYQNPNHEINF